MAEKSADAAVEFSQVTDKIKTLESRQKEVAELQRQIGNYGKTRDAYAAYKRSEFDTEFYEKNRANIALHEAAKRHFSSLCVKNLPKISELKQEYATLQVKKKRLYVGYHELKETSREFLVAKHNVQRILDMPAPPQNQDVSRTAPATQIPEI